MIGQHGSSLQGALGIAEAIVQKAMECANALDDDITRLSPRGSPAYLQNRLELFYESLCFFAHAVSRVVFRQLGPTKRQQLNDALGPLLVEFTVSHFYRSTTASGPKARDAFKRRFYECLDASERQYSRCTAMIVKVEDDVSPADKKFGVTSRGAVNHWTDQVVGILDEHNPVTYHRIMVKLISVTGNFGEFEKSIIAALAEP